jgi:hypothetical protein
MLTPGTVVLSSEAVIVPETSRDCADKFEFSTKNETTKAQSPTAPFIRNKKGSFLFIGFGLIVWFEKIKVTNIR